MAPIRRRANLATGHRCYVVVQETNFSPRTLYLEDALQLAHVYGERGSPQYDKAALRWLERAERAVARLRALL